MAEKKHKGNLDNLIQQHMDSWKKGTPMANKKTPESQQQALAISYSEQAAGKKAKK